MFRPASGDEMEIKLPDEGGAAAPALTPANSGSGTDLNSRLSGMNYDSFQTGGKDGYSSKSGKLEMLGCKMLFSAAAKFEY